MIMLTLPDEIREQLDQARARVADEQSSLDAIETTRPALLDELAAIQAKIAALDARAAKRRDGIAEAERALGAVEETALHEFTLNLADEILRLHAESPRKNHQRVIALGERLQSCLHSELDWPINLPYSTHPLIKQALNLLPERDPLHVPLSVSGFGMPWPQRRKLLLAAFEDVTPPLEAA